MLGAFFTLRPQVLGYIFMLIMLVGLERYRQGISHSLWWLPALFLIWVNTHGTFFLGLGVFGIYWLTGLANFSYGGIYGEKWSPEQRLHMLQVALLSVVLLPLDVYKRQEAARLRAQQMQPRLMPEIIATSESMSQMLDMAKRIAPCDVSVLITGETGTGKELVARMIHRLSPRSVYPIVAFSCANLPDTLVEDELFGHERGAFTGAQAMRRGRLEAADRGTLFLDEVGDIGIALQPKLLRVLQERNFERLGSNRSVSVNIRVVCATNRDLSDMVEHGKFREDLYLSLIHI